MIGPGLGELEWLGMQALPSALKGLIEEEVKMINAEIEKHPELKADFPDGVLDRTRDYQEIICNFVEWYVEARQTGTRSQPTTH